MCSEKPATLALYAPQLTIPGFDDGFSDVFDDLMSPKRLLGCEAFRYGRAETADGEPPLCGDFVAWRHPMFGNYSPGELSYEFVSAHDGSYSRQVFNGFECLIWLLSNDSSWMPEDLRETLKRGFRDRVSWWVTQQVNDSSYAVVTFLLERPRSRFRYTQTLRADLVGWCDQALKKLEIAEDPGSVCRASSRGDFWKATTKRSKGSEKQERHGGVTGELASCRPRTTISTATESCREPEEGWLRSLSENEIASPIGTKRTCAAACSPT